MYSTTRINYVLGREAYILEGLFSLDSLSKPSFISLLSDCVNANDKVRD
jgi:hypothetical protein